MLRVALFVARGSGHGPPGHCYGSPHGESGIYLVTKGEDNSNSNRGMGEKSFCPSVCCLLFLVCLVSAAADIFWSQACHTLILSPTGTFEYNIVEQVYSQSEIGQTVSLAASLCGVELRYSMFWTYGRRLGYVAMLRLGQGGQHENLSDIFVDLIAKMLCRFNNRFSNYVCPCSHASGI